MKRKLTVVTDAAGNVVVTQLGHGGERDPKSGILVAITAGPGQTLHKVEFEYPVVFSSPDDIDAFHQKLAKHLKKSG
jgi:hypothetical protein